MFILHSRPTLKAEPPTFLVTNGQRPLQSRVDARDATCHKAQIKSISSYLHRAVLEGGHVRTFHVLTLIGSFLIVFGGRAPAAEPDIELRSIYARNYNLSELVEKGTRASVFVFMRPGCPAVELALPALKTLEKEYRAKGIAFYAVYSYAGVNIRSMAAHTQQFDIPLRAFLDVKQALAKHWDVKRTATAVIVDKNKKKLYQGAILEGDQSGRIEGFYLKEALDEFLAGKEIKTAERPAQGCVITTRPPQYTKGLTFHKDIEPIIQAKCQRCHRPGEVAPMSLLTYDDVSSYADMIAQVVEDRIMPPWPVESPLAIKETAGLTNKEIRNILGWINEGSPEGKPEEAPPARVWPDPAKWAIGEPDLLFKSRAFAVPATGIVPYIYTRQPIDADQDIFLEALEVKPGARRVVHHMAIHEFPYSDKPITAVDLLKIYGLEVSNNILGAYVPGIQPRILPPGHAIRIKKGMGVLIDAHYTPYGKEVTDQTQVGFKIRKTPPEREVFSRWFYRSRGRFLIPAGDGHVVMFRDDISFDKDIEILGIRPHLHARGKSFLVEKIAYQGAEPGKEKAEKLLALPRWDFKWQYDYMLEKPLRLSGGESIRITGSWDNTDFNPTNPDPKVDVQFGEQTQDEMMGILLIWRNAESNGGDK